MAREAHGEDGKKDFVTRVSADLKVCVDVKGNRVDVKGNCADGKGNCVDSKANTIGKRYASSSL
eukprot:1359789-Pyramimonas_sp.AAC.1